MGRFLVKIVEWTKKAFRLKTYQVEMVFVFVLLAATVVISDGGYIEWLGATAVFLTFGHASVADRLAEVQAEKPKEEVEVACFYKLHRYYYGKEILWLVYFVLLHAWSALTGVFIFMVYLHWRRLWRKYHPRTK